MRWFLAAAAVVWCACAATNATCPAGSKLVSTVEPAGRTEVCASSNAMLGSIPVPGRAFESALDIGPPPAISGGIEGPYTSWYPDGSLHAHGTYVDLGGRSLPDGVWAFWYPSGKRRTLGVYHRGEPVGCFAVWDEAGALSTGFVHGTELSVDACEPPSDRGLDIVEGRVTAVDGPPTGDVSVLGFMGAAGMGARNSGQIVRDPSLGFAFDLDVRKRFGHLFIGPTVGIRSSNDADYMSYVGGATVAYVLPRLHSRIGEEIGLDLAVQYIRATAMKPMQFGQDRLHLWSPLPAARLDVAFQLSSNVELVAGARVEGVPLRDSQRIVNYCDFAGCLPPQEETWRVGGVGVGATGGIRLVFR